MKVINKSFAIILAFLLTGSLTCAQSVGSAGTASISVSATVGSGTSSISIVQGAINFGDTVLLPIEGDSRYISEAITIKYFAANGPWEIRVYTQDQNDAQGLVSTGSSSTVLLKITPEDKEGGFGDVKNDDHWSGEDELLRFFTVLDDDAKELNTTTPFYAIAASSKNENPSKNDDFKIKFGVDVAGAADEEHKAEVTFDLAIL